MSLCAMLNGYLTIPRETKTDDRASIIRSILWQWNGMEDTCPFPSSSSFTFPSSHSLLSSISALLLFFSCSKLLSFCIKKIHLFHSVCFEANFIPFLAGGKNSHSLLRLMKTVKDTDWSRPSVYCTVSPRQACSCLTSVHGLPIRLTRVPVSRFLLT